MSGALPLFGDAYLADTAHLTLEEHGAYLKLLLIAWRTANCALPDDDRRLATMLGIGAKKWATLRPAVMSFWALSEHGWQQKRLLKERRWVDEKSAKARAAANHLHAKSFPPGAFQEGDNQFYDVADETGKTLNNNNVGDANAGANACANGGAPPPPPKKEKKEQPPTPLPTVDAQARAPSERKAIRLPDDWQPEPPTPRILTITYLWQPGELEAQLQRFRDHWAASAQPTARKHDWQAAWRTWIGKHHEQRPATSPTVQRNGARTGDGFENAIARQVERARSAGGSVADEGGGSGDYGEAAGSYRLRAAKAYTCN